ncbi:pyridoxal phosphate-dependent aspartate aminotransferase [Oleiphilus messinensis]|uniref:Pyridoxal phosphate-dependent aspartate aminotransferase n=1 Tax=Oleiphilus messinensis TaxID=141451 RepID=A0A1Y0IG73_9GAMM|nr:DegT/DnrJ/EryC1/StrS family aminotransferase [Oleiphilus messinensis]ARU59497.1 pyridoxal phosphate-dependent aspartate aminotransferase [Oleiphilus messinensis]
MEFIDLTTQFQRLENKIRTRMDQVLRHGRFIMGPEVAEFEEKLAHFIGVNHAIGVANGTDALQLALMALEIKPGDRVITTPFSFFATAEVIALIGAIPVFTDIDQDTFNLSASSLEQTIADLETRGTPARAVITVDLFGQPADYPKISALCDKHNLYLIEDAAQGLGGAVGEQKAGSFGTVACTSFFPAKPLGCFGDGGAVMTQDAKIANTLMSLRMHGKGTDKYDNVRIGLNSRLDTLQAAILLEKLAVFAEECDLRNQVAQRYHDGLSGIPELALPKVPENMNSSWAQFTLRCENRDALKSHLTAAQIPSAVYYPCPMHLSTAFAGLQHQTGDFPFAEQASQTVLSIPMSPYLSEQDQERVVQVIRAFFQAD